ncbi:hypothetical protein [Zoogloea sp.]|uniref:hypothetical protein n=1 Tax=Zoogloea sp. TaxID=49181 RepID=UPI00262CD052|nr:hypothetical protein [Zoogloea sp.]MDD3352939.1 hypothetical protein [Zoogloea sp.]
MRTLLQHALSGLPALALCLTVGLVLPGTALATPQLLCTVSQSGTERTLSATPTRNPYGVPATDIQGHFRFKPVVVGDANSIEYVSIQTYVQTPRGPVLLHQVGYTHPPLPEGPDSTLPLGGIHAVYAPGLGRELRYACILREAKP